MKYTKQMLTEVGKSITGSYKIHHFYDKRWEGFVYRILRSLRFYNWKLIHDALLLLDQGHYVVEHCSYNRNTGYRVSFDDTPEERSRWWQRRRSPIEVYLLKKADMIVIPLPKMTNRWEFMYIMIHNNTMLVTDKFSAETLMGNTSHKTSPWDTNTLWDILVSKCNHIPFKEEL